jgi:hypothetical protein
MQSTRSLHPAHSPSARSPQKHHATFSSSVVAAVAQQTAQAVAVVECCTQLPHAFLLAAFR